MDELRKKQIDAHMAEFSALRGEISVYSQRIDRTVGIYLSALFGLFGFLIRPDSAFEFTTYLGKIRESPSLVASFLVLGILNCLLIVRIQSFYLAVLAMSQYTATYLGPTISTLLGTKAFRWDDPDLTRAKKYWVPVRGAAQTGFGALAILVSVAVATTAWPPCAQGRWVTLLYLALILAIGYVMYVQTKVFAAARNFHETPVALHQIELKAKVEP